MKFAIDNVIDSWFDGITASQVTEALEGLKDGETLELSINSPGGDVYEGIAIFNAIREVAKTHPVVVTINGLAASMASYIALAARTVDGNAVVKASDNSIFMIHNPYTGMYGDYKKFEKTASYLKQLAGALSGVYQSVSKKSEKDIRALMDETTFFVGNEIFENGFANECTISVAYAFGEGRPIMLQVVTEKRDNHKMLTQLINERFDFRPEAIIERLGLRQFSFLPTSRYGHFSNSDYPWEQVYTL